MKTTKYYHKNSDVVAFKRIDYQYGCWYEYTYDERGLMLAHKDSDGHWSESIYDERGNELTYKDSFGSDYESTYDEQGNELTYKSSNGYFEIKGKEVTEEEFNNFLKSKQ